MPSHPITHHFIRWRTFNSDSTAIVQRIEVITRKGANLASSNELCLEMIRCARWPYSCEGDQISGIIFYFSSEFFT